MSNSVWRWLTSFVTAAGLLTSGPVSAIETITYFHNDIAGTPVLATDATGEVVWKENYTPYGDKLIRDPASTENDLWYTGKPHDDATGLTYMGARYYDPVVGRFMGVDPKEVEPGDVHSFNRYAYGNNNPYRYIDPNGRESVDTVAYRLATGMQVAPDQWNNHRDPQLVQPVPGFTNASMGTDTAVAVLGLATAGGAAKTLVQTGVRSFAASGTKHGVDDLIKAADGQARSSGDIVVQGGRDKAKELFREFDVKGGGNRTIVRDKTGGGRGIVGELGDGTPLRIRMKPDGTTRLQAGDQKFIFPPQ